ncbi:MAG: HAMP domain-containing histidine kinase, partial [Alistipes sp.]|nr:HAMP domain-containing histidine kinase [Alistipes sp.]
MEVWFLVIMGIMAVFIVLLLAKVYMLRKAAEEIEAAFRDRLADDTNTLIDISGHDRQMRKLADSINVQLRELRGQRHRFLQGDQELKEAVTNISHDLRTPLTAVRGYLDLLEREENSPAADRYIEIIRNRTEIMKSLTDELFSYSVLLTGESGGKKEVIVNHVLEESIAAYYAAFKERGIEPDIEISEKKVIRIVDRSALS